MTVSTWTWRGGSGISTVAGGWTLTAGAGDPANLPQPGDFVIVPSGTITDGVPLLTGVGTIDVINSGQVQLSLPATGLALGVVSGTTGSVIVNGSAAALALSALTSGLTLGVAGTGGLTVGNAGTVTTPSLALAGSLSGPAGGKASASLSGGSHIEIGTLVALWAGATLAVDATSGADIGPSNTYVAGAVNIESGETLMGDGLVSGSVQNNGGAIDVTNNGTLTSSTGGHLTITGSIGGTGTINLEAGSTLEVDGSIGAGQTINFATGAPETLIVGSPGATMTNKINGFAEGDKLEFPVQNIATVSGFSQFSGTQATITFANGTTLGIGGIKIVSGTPTATTFAIDPQTDDAFFALTNTFNWTVSGGTTSVDLNTDWSATNGASAVPGTEDLASMSSSLPNTILGTLSAAFANFSGKGLWTLGSGTGITSNIATSVGPAGAVGSVLVGAGSTLSSSGFFYVGAAAGGVGTLTVSGGGVVQQLVPIAPVAADMVIGATTGSGILGPGSGTVTVTGTGSAIDLAYNGLALGNTGGTGTLTVSLGGSVLATSANSAVADAILVGQTGSGAVTVTDPGSRVTADGVVAVAGAQTGTLTVQNTGSFLAAPDAFGLSGLIIGDGNAGGLGGTAFATVTTGGVLGSAGFLDLGVDGTTGQMTVVNGGTVQIGGALTVGLGGTIANGPTAAQSGVGTLTIGAGGTVQLTGTPRASAYGVILGDSNVGQASSENASIAVTGTGALLDADGSGIAVGQYGTAALQVTQGGSVTSGTPASASIAALTVGRQGSGTLTVSGAGSRLSANGAASIGEAGTGILIVQSQGSAVFGLDPQNAGGLAIGGTATNAGGTLWTGGIGSASVSAGGDLLSTSAIIVGENGASGSLSVLTGGTAEAGTQVLIGGAAAIGAGTTIISPSGTAIATSATMEAGAGTVTVVPGAELLAGGSIAAAGTAGIVIGSGPGGMGALTVSGAGATVNTANSGLDVGELGRGTLLISLGGSVATGAKFATDSALVAGGASGVSGGITVTDTGSSIDSAGQVVIGQAGSGQLVIQNAATAITGGSTLVPSQGIDAGEQAGGAGNILVTGAGSLLKNTGSFIVGDAGIGSLSIEAGAVVITTPGTTGFGGMMIGDTASSGGSSVSLIGAGSSLSVTGLLDVGNAGSGALTLTGGATVTAGSLDAGIISTAVAQIGVSGAGTELSVAGTATIADDGTGVLSVLNGATFLAASLTIGTQGDSSGALVISGAGSVVDLTGSLNIGTALGTGALTIGPGAVVNASVIDLQGGVVLEGGLLDPTVYIENGGSTTGGFGTIASDYILLEGTILSNGSKSGKETEVVEGTIVGGGTADIKGSVSVNGPGILQIGTHDTIELTGAVLNAATTTFTDNLTPTGTYSVNNSVIDVVFQDSTGVLQIDDIAGFAGTVATWKAGDQFVITGGTLSDLNVSNGDTLTFSDSGTGAGAGGIDSIIFGAAIGAGAFGIVNGNTVQAVACFAEGTQIDTEDGWVAVEDLGVGDQVMLADGEREPIVWIGQRDVRCLSHPVPETVWPVRVSAGAFGENVPRRDLYLSPDHAVFVDGVLVPVKFLINGSSIVQVQRDRVRYFHVELAEHAVILAEGLPVESYLDIGDRLDFGQNGVMRLHPDFGARLAADIALAWEARGVAPLVMTGEALAGARRLRA